jgi:tripartite-type tricarboxylate transporter receptor subunit TctC
MSFSSLGAAMPLIQAGQLRAVAVTSKGRMPQLPDVAPLAEAPGMAGYELINWFGMFCPAGVPAPIQARLAEAASAAIADPAMAAKLVEQGAIPRQMTQAEMRSFVAEETRKFAEIITRANISVEG